MGRCVPDGGAAVREVVQVVQELGNRPLQQVGVVAQEALDDRRVRLGVLLAVAVASTKMGQ